MTSLDTYACLLGSEKQQQKMLQEVFFLSFFQKMFQDAPHVLHICHIRKHTVISNMSQLTRLQFLSHR